MRKERKSRSIKSSEICFLVVFFLFLSHPPATDRLEIECCVYVRVVSVEIESSFDSSLEEVGN